MEKANSKWLIISYLVLFLFINNTSALGVVFEYDKPNEEAPSYSYNAAYSNMEYESPSMRSGNLMNNFSPSAALGSSTGEDDLPTTGAGDNDAAYNDVPLGNGIFILISMIFIYVMNMMGYNMKNIIKSVKKTFKSHAYYTLN